MKNSVTVLAVVLILLFSFVGSVFALERPYHDPLRPGGDDHPWGGGNQVIDNPTIINSTKTPTLIATGSAILDLAINEFLYRWHFESLYIQTEQRQVYRTTFTRTRNYSEKGVR